MSRLQTFRSACATAGITNTLLYIWKTKILNSTYRVKSKTRRSYSTGTLRSKELQHPILFRYGSSDIGVFSQIFIGGEYRSLAMSKNVKLVLDCGANVGYSSAYFLSKFPQARVIAVEPDERNYELLQKNLHAYGNRVTIVRSAIWSHKVGLKVCAEGSAEHSEWATTVRECMGDEMPDLQAVDIGTLLNQSTEDSIDILKLDIEGSERVVFSRNFQSWIDRVRILVIELHGPECRDIFFRATSDSFNYTHAGEITIARQRIEPNAGMPLAQS